ncbi:MAG: NAD(P)H-hydrate dehydratase [Eubacteriaceae bacterium]|nr:NAD(P)H-hydrate dehydratase [Eubacteriaceae bacterium]
MLLLVTPQEMLAIDRAAQEQFGIPSIVLMENAAAAITQKLLNDEPFAQLENVLVVCGKGDNGGDGLAIARRLYLAGKSVKVRLLSDISSLSANSVVNLGICAKLGIDLSFGESFSLEGMGNDLSWAGYVVDAIFGAGFSGKAEGGHGKAINKINESGKPVAAVDVPSGLDPLTGCAPGPAINAHTTYALGYIKIGLVCGPATGSTGHLELLDFGLPSQLASLASGELFMMDSAYVNALIPARQAVSHKGDYGKVLIYAGSEGMCGAAALSSAAAMKSGTGLSYIACPAGLAQTIDQMAVESVVVPCGLEGRKTHTIQGAEQVLDRAQTMDALAIGPGLSLDTEALESARSLILNVKGPKIIDADGLNAIAKDRACLADVSNAVLTPHEAEMARLAEASLIEVVENRLYAATEFAREFGVVVLLKGRHTIIADPNGRVAINPTGNAGMATAGSGDVLTGIIASMLGQGLGLFDAACVGAYAHGLAGDLAAAKLGQAGMTAVDILSAVPLSFKELA